MHKFNDIQVILDIYQNETKGDNINEIAKDLEIFKLIFKIKSTSYAVSKVFLWIRIFIISLQFDKFTWRKIYDGRNLGIFYSFFRRNTKRV